MNNVVQKTEQKFALVYNTLAQARTIQKQHPIRVIVKVGHKYCVTTVDAAKRLKLRVIK